MCVSVIIVHYHVEDYLNKCLNSIFKNDDKIVKDIYIVNNGSNKKIEYENTKIHLIENLNNVGFSSANNLCLKTIKYKYCLLLNPDTLIKFQTITKCVHYLDQHPNVGVLGCKVLNDDNSLQSSCRNFPSISNIVFETLGIHELMKKIHISTTHYLQLWDHKTVMKVDSVKGAFLLTRQSVIDQVGLLDESFFMYCEEVDFCKRVKENGWNVVFYPEAEIIHYGGKSTEINSLTNLIELHRSQRYYCRKHMNTISAEICIGFYLLGVILRMIYSLPMPWDHSKVIRKKIIRFNLFFKTARSYFK